MSYLIDTNIVSELRKSDRADGTARTWFESLHEEDLYLSVLTVGELRHGVELRRRRDPDAAASLDRWLNDLVRTFEHRILPVDRAVCEEWGRMAVPNPVPVVDGLLAATAKVMDLTFATRNSKHIESTGVAWINPFHRAD